MEIKSIHNLDAYKNREKFFFEKSQKLQTPTRLLKLFNNEEKQIEISWITLENSVVLIQPGADGVVFPDNNTAILQTQKFRRPIQKLSYSDNLVTELDYEATICADPGWYNYYHWLLTVLPFMLHSNEVYPKSKILLPNYDSYNGHKIKPAFTKKTYYDSINLSLGSTEKIEFLEPGYYRLPKLHLCRDKHAYFHSFHQYFVETVKRDLQKYKNKEKIFISRVNAETKSRVNDNVHQKLQQLADQIGYKTIFLEQLDWKQQRELFLNTSHVLAAHGSGLANIIFAEDLTVYEYNQLYNAEQQRRDHFYNLSNILGHKYYLITDDDIDYVAAEMFS